MIRKSNKIINIDESCRFLLYKCYPTLPPSLPPSLPRVVELGSHLISGVNGNGKADAVAVLELHAVDAHHFSIQVHEGAACFLFMYFCSKKIQLTDGREYKSK